MTSSLFSVIALAQQLEYPELVPRGRGLGLGHCPACDPACHVAVDWSPAGIGDYFTTQGFAIANGSAL